MKKKSLGRWDLRYLGRHETGSDRGGGAFGRHLSSYAGNRVPGCGGVAVELAVAQ